MDTLLHLNREGMMDFVSSPQRCELAVDTTPDEPSPPLSCLETRCQQLESELASITTQCATIVSNASLISNLNEKMELEVTRLQEEIKSRDALLRLMQRHDHFASEDSQGIILEYKKLKKALSKQDETIHALKLLLSSKDREIERLKICLQNQHQQDPKSSGLID